MLTLTAKKTEKLKGGEVIARMIRAEGVEKVFGIIDGTYFGFYSSLSKLGIDLITPRHESSAAHMAGAYARASGKLGVCMASNGPGVANILSGLVVESAEGNRVLLITSSRRAAICNPDRGGTFQCFPQTEVTRPVTKWSGHVPSSDRLAEMCRHALRVCFEGRPGVVHLDVPEDIMNGKFELNRNQVWKPTQYRTVAPPAPAPELVKAAAALLTGAKRPTIHAGSGVIHAGAWTELGEIAQLLHAPVTTSWGARGAVDERQGYAIPLCHLDLCSKVRREADVVLVLGSRLGETDWWGKAPYWSANQKTIQVDLDAVAIGRNKPVEVGVISCVRTFLTDLKLALEASAGEMDIAERKKRLLALQDERSKERAKLDKKLNDKSTPLHSAHVPATAQAVLGDDALMVVDGGNTAIWSTFFYEARTPNGVLTTFKMGMLGAGLPQALGVKAARPDREVYLITGDGAFGMQLQELETAVRTKLKVISLVLCDKQWGMVKMNQQFMLKPLKTLVMGSLGPDETINADLCEIAFDEVAKNMGAHGERVESPDQLKAALERCRDHDGPSVIHVEVDPVKHMWAPALKAFKDMHGEPRG